MSGRLYSADGALLVADEMSSPVADDALHNQLLELTSGMLLLLKRYADNMEAHLRDGLTPDQRQQLNEELGQVQETALALLEGGVQLGFYRPAGSEPSR